MVTVTITVSGSPGELVPVLRYIADQQLHLSMERDRESSEPQPEELSWSWNEDKVRIIWRDLSSGCREILKEIAKHDDGISTSALMKKLDLTANEVGGHLSSLGHRLRKHKLNKLPYPLDWVEDSMYRMVSVWRYTIPKIEPD